MYPPHFTRRIFWYESVGDILFWCAGCNMAGTMQRRPFKQDQILWAVKRISLGIMLYSEWPIPKSQDDCTIQEYVFLQH